MILLRATSLLRIPDRNGRLSRRRRHRSAGRRLSGLSWIRTSWRDCWAIIACAQGENRGIHTCLRRENRGIHTCLRRGNRGIHTCLCPENPAILTCLRREGPAKSRPAPIAEKGAIGLLSARAHLEDRLRVSTSSECRAMSPRPRHSLARQ